MDQHRPAPAITFCVPFYRGLGYLDTTLRSVLAQTTQDWQCIVVDDVGPEPGADALVASFGDPRFSYMRNAANLGLAGNWNRCLELARSSYVTLLHADDRLRPEYATEMIRLAGVYPEAAAFFCRAAIIDADGREAFSFADRFKNLLMPSRHEIISLKGEAGLASIMRGNFVFCPTLCYRRDRLRLPAFDPAWRMVLDLEWLSRALLDGGELIGTPLVGYEYRRHEENQTSILTRSKTRFHEEIAIQRKVAEACARQGWPRAEAAARTMMSVRLHLLYQAAMRLVRLDLREAVSFLCVLLSSTRPQGAAGGPDSWPRS